MISSFSSAARHAVWAEFMPYQWVEADLPRFRQAGLQLNLAIPAERQQLPELKQLLQRAQAAAVPVGAWLLLPDQAGYWPNAENATAFAQLVERFLGWLQQHKLQVAEIIVDMETPLALSRLMKGQLLRGLQLEWKRWRHPRNHEQFWKSVSLFQQLVEQIHQAGLRAQVVTYPLVVHDLKAGNTAFQEFLQVPVTPIAWDQVSLMTYRSSFEDMLPLQLSSGFVYQYLHTACQHFEVPVSAALGVIGSVGKVAEGGFRDPEQLLADTQAALAAGVCGVQLFSLDGMHELGAPDPWLQIFQRAQQAPAQAPQPTLSDRSLWQSMQRSHQLLSRLQQTAGFAPPSGFRPQAVAAAVPAELSTPKQT